MPLAVSAIAGASRAKVNNSEYEALNTALGGASDWKEANTCKTGSGRHSRTVYAFSRSEESDSSEGESFQSFQQDGLQHCPLRMRVLHLLETQLWTGVVMTAIALNTMMMAIQCNYPHWSQWFIFEDSFLLFFFVEISLRLCGHGLHFFTDLDDLAWNLFDLTVVVAGLVDFAMQALLAGDKGGQALTAFRIIRIVRILRSCRLLKHFKQLYMLVQGFMHSLVACFWIGVLFFLVVLIAGIMVTNVVGRNADEWASGPHADMEDVKTIELLFGSLPRSMITMFQLVTLDKWGDINLLVAKRMPVMTLFFILYIMATAFAMIALLTGVITENVTAVSRESELHDAEEKFQAYTETLEGVFRHAESVDGEPGVAFEEVCNLLRDPKVAEKMELENILTAADLYDIYKALDYDGDGRVSWQEFRHGLRDMHGPASAKEVALLRADMSELRLLANARCGGSGVDLQPRIAALEGQIQRLEGSVQGLLRALSASGR